MAEGFSVIQLISKSLFRTNILILQKYLLITYYVLVQTLLFWVVISKKDKYLYWGVYILEYITFVRSNERNTQLLSKLKVLLEK